MTISNILCCRGLLDSPTFVPQSALELSIQTSLSALVKFHIFLSLLSSIKLFANTYCDITITCLCKELHTVTSSYLVTMGGVSPGRRGVTLTVVVKGVEVGGRPILSMKVSCCDCWSHPLVVCK